MRLPSHCALCLTAALTACASFDEFSFEPADAQTADGDGAVGTDASSGTDASRGTDASNGTDAAQKDATTGTDASRGDASVDAAGGQCSANETRACALTTTGLEVDFPVLDDDGLPLGECRLGTQSCSDQGSWGSCSGTVAPGEEICDHADNDCDGTVDNVNNPPTFYYDADGDLHAASWASPVVGCFAPAAAPAACSANQALCPDDGWTSSPIPQDDCDDAVDTRYPGAPEICNRRDDNCDNGGGVETAEDVDNDGFTDRNYASCSTGFPKTDCYDLSADVRPDQTKRFDVGYCLNENAQVWCFTRRECAAKDDCADSIGQVWGPGSVDYDCDGTEEPLLVTPAESAAYSAACAALTPPNCTSAAAPTYAVAGAECGAVGQHSQCTYQSASDSCGYSSTFLMTACF